jgi:prevent-host-death family protein
MAITVNIHEAKTQFSQLVARAAAGEEILIARGGKPVARLISLGQSSATRAFGTAKGKVRIAKNFDGPIPGFEAFHK